MAKQLTAIPFSPVLLLCLITACLFTELSGPKSRPIMFSISCDSLGQSVRCSDSLSLGDTLHFRVDSSGLGAGTSKIEWSSTNPVVASIDPITGLAHGDSLGSDTIIARLIAPERDSEVLQSLQVVQLASAESSFVMVLRDTLSSGDSATLVVRARDKFGKNLTIGGDSVAFTHSGGQSTGRIAPVPATDSGNGIYTATFTAIKAGSATTIRATVNGVPVGYQTPPRITVRAGPPKTIRIVAGDGQSATAGTKVKVPPKVRVLDLNDNAVPGVEVTFTVTSGGIGAVEPSTPVRTDSSGLAAATAWLLDTVAYKVNTVTATVTPSGLALTQPISAVATVPQLMPSIPLGNLLLVDAPKEVAVDPRRNRIYVASASSSGISLIDGNAADTARLMVSAGAGLLTVDSLSGRLFVTSSDTLKVYDGLISALLGQTVLSWNPTGLAYLPSLNQLWVASNQRGSVFVLDANTLGLLFRVGVPGCGKVALNPTTNRGYVLTGSGLTVVDAVGDTVITSFSRPLSVDGQIAVNSVTNLVFASSDSGLEVFDGSAGWQRTIPLLPNSFLQERVFGISVDETANRVYATVYRELQPDPSNRVRDDLLVIIDSTYAVTRISTGEELGGVAADPSTKRVYVAATRPVSAVRVLDQLANRITKDIVRAGPPVAVAIDEARGRVYVVDSVTNNMFVIDGTANQVLGLPVHYSEAPQSSRAMAVDVGENRLFITHGEAPGYVDVLDGQSYQYLHTVLVGNSPSAIALNQATHEAYIANADGTVSVIDTVRQTASITTGTPSWRSIQGVAVDATRNLAVTVNRFAVIDGAGKAIIPSVDCGCGGGVALNPATKHAYAGLNLDDNDQRVAVIDYTVGRQDTAVAINGVPEAVGLNPVANVVFVPTDAGIAVISGDLPVLVYTVPRRVSTSGPGIAVNSVTGLIYIADVASNSVVIIRN